MSADELRQARAYLLRVAEPPAPAVVAFVSAHGPIAAAARIRRGDCPDEVLKVTEARSGYDLVSQDFARAAEAGARLVVPEDDEWPAWPLHAIDVAAQCGVAEAVQPLALWVVGDVALGTAADRAVAIVGARAATDYGEHHAAEFAYGLASRNVPVVSGAAYGIDGAAHRGALAAEGITAAVLGCAVDAGYPAGHVAMLKRVVQSGGAVISEYPPGTSPARHRFLVRNRLMRRSLGVAGRLSRSSGVFAARWPGADSSAVQQVS
ncbi:DNA-processing protein DprA, partial [Amycolatopsis sp. NPDC003861]